MKLSLTHAPPVQVDTDLLVVTVAGADFAKQPTFRSLDQALSGELTRIAKLEDFTAKKGQALQLHTFGKLGARKLRLHALPGKEVSEEDCRMLGVQAARAARDFKSVAVCAPSGEPAHVRAVGEGLILGGYRYTEYLSGARKGKPAPRGVIVTSDKPRAALATAIVHASIVAEAVNLARDLVNRPPNEMTAVALAAEARRVSREHGIRCTVWGKQEIVKHGMTLLAAVNAGSGAEPRFIHMAYVPKARGTAVTKLPRLVFVGKGLTFDAGGLSIKPAKSMETMKCDMAGGAATIALVMAAARLKLPAEVHGIIPSTDNLLGPHAYKPGDVYRTLGGKTVEVLNTDAEGRLILADALAYAQKLEPTVLIDHATLTGACMVALGQWRAGLYANDTVLLERYRDAARRSGEPFWPMPLDEDLKDTIKSSIADIKNVGDAYGGSVSAALFLQEFVGECKWVHLDIAGPAFLPAPHGANPKGGTGFGVRTALEFIQSYAGEKR